MQVSARCKARDWQKSKTAKLLGGRNVNEHIHSLNSLGIFKENFFETIRYIGLTISEITEVVMLFQYSEILFY